MFMCTTNCVAPIALFCGVYDKHFLQLDRPSFSDNVIRKNVFIFVFITNSITFIANILATLQRTVAKMCILGFSCLFFGLSTYTNKTIAAFCAFGNVTSVCRHVLTKNWVLYT